MKNIALITAFSLTFTLSSFANLQMLNLDDLERIGDKGIGANEGGLYHDPSSGTRYFIKRDTQAQYNHNSKIINEYLAGQLLQLTTPHNTARIFLIEGKPNMLASQAIPSYRPNVEFDFSKEAIKEDYYLHVISTLLDITDRSVYNIGAHKPNGIWEIAHIDYDHAFNFFSHFRPFNEDEFKFNLRAFNNLDLNALIQAVKKVSEINDATLLYPIFNALDELKAIYNKDTLAERFSDIPLGLQIRKEQLQDQVLPKLQLLKAFFDLTKIEDIESAFNSNKEALLEASKSTFNLLGSVPLPSLAAILGKNTHLKILINNKHIPKFVHLAHFNRIEALNILAQNNITHCLDAKKLTSRSYTESLYLPALMRFGHFDRVLEIQAAANLHYNDILQIALEHEHTPFFIQYYKHLTATLPKVTLSEKILYFTTIAVSKVDLWKTLIHDIDPNIQDINKRTPLHNMLRGSLSANKPEFLQFLLDHGANPFIQDRWNKTVYELAPDNLKTIIDAHLLKKSGL